MKVKGIAAPAPKVRRLSIAAACLAFFLAIIEPANASSNMQQVFITIPADQLPSPELPGSENLDPNPGVPSLLELGMVKAVDASAMALLSIAARQIESARQPAGAKAFAKELALNTYQWSDDQFDCLNKIWTKESHWNYKARNKISGAHGIPQALPATKMESIGTDWRTNPVTQITWGLSYIEKRYETPCRALVKFKRSNWY